MAAEKSLAYDYVEEVEKPIDFKYYFFLFTKNFYVLLTFFAIALTLAIIYASKLPDQFVSVAQIIIEKPKNAWQEKDGLAGSQETESWSEDYYNTQKEIMTSTTVMRQVISELKLSSYFETDAEEALVDQVRGMMTVDRIRTSRLFNISVTAGDAQLSANLANAIARAYIRKNFEDFLYYSKEILAWLPQEGQSESDTITIEDPFGKVKQVSRKELIDSLPSLQTDETIRELKEKKSFLEAELQSLLRQYREKHPLIVKGRANLKFLEESIAAEKNRVIENLKNQAEGRLQASHARLLEEALPPKAPVGPNRQKIILLAVLAELFLSLLIVFLLDYFDDTVHSLEDMERKGISLPFLGPVPLTKKVKKLDPDQASLVTYHDKKSEVAESFRYLRVAINFSASPESLKNLVISSCLPHEGKSFCSHNIAVSLALDGNKTLLVDADLRRPVVHHRFRIENDTGLSNYLTSDLDFDSVAKESFLENLTIVPSGPISPNPAEILGSEKMKNFLAEARKRYDRVIVDCPPLTGLGDGYVVGNLVGHIIMVIYAGKTPADLILRTQKQLEKMGIKVIGAILNQVDVEKEKYSGYSKYYYHTYSRYYHNEDKS